MIKYISIFLMLSACDDVSPRDAIINRHHVQGAIACLDIDAYTATCRDSSGEIWICGTSPTKSNYSCARVSAAISTWDLIIGKKAQ